jgi:hypothetical protein
MELKHTNYRVICTLDQSRWDTHQSMMRDCKDLIEQIKKHCDGTNAMDFEWDDECPHCRSAWEPSFDREGPACCETALAEWTLERLKGEK